jgi:hypothetical protein
MLSLKFGLILFAFKSEDTQPIAVWRDFQGFFRDEKLIDSTLLDSSLGTYHVLPAHDVDYSRQRRSFMFDWVLSNYFLNPLIDTASRHCGIDLRAVQSAVRQITLTYLTDTDAEYLPRAGYYRMSLEEPKGRFLPFEKVNTSPTYR